LWFSVRRENENSTVPPIDSIYFKFSGCADIYSKFTNCARYQKGWGCSYPDSGNLRAKCLERSQFRAIRFRAPDASLVLCGTAVAALDLDAAKAVSLLRTSVLIGKTPIRARAESS
jgi:hypothetical protein